MSDDTTIAPDRLMSKRMASPASEQPTSSSNHHFFEKLRVLRDRYPYLPYNFRVYKGVENTNCPYCDEMTLCSDCHLCFTCADLTRSAYCSYMAKSQNCLDCDGSNEMQLCYECTGYSEKCFECTYCNRCVSCFKCDFCDSCEDLNECFGCVEIDHKKFCIFNKQYTETEYRTHVAKLRARPAAMNLADVARLRAQIPVVDIIGYENQDAELCAYSFFNNRCYDLSYSRENEDCAYLIEVMRCKYLSDANLVYNVQTCYEISNSDTLTHSAYLVDCARAQECYLCNLCTDCTHCFGCVGLEYKDYCILNKQYSKEDYERIVPQLLAEFATNSVDMAGEWYDIWSLEVA